MEKMGFFDRLEETFRNHTRDNICAGLRTLGVDAQMEMSRRAAEEAIRIGWCVGVIDISEGPIRWVNVCSYYTDYGVPDLRLGPDSPRLRIVCNLLISR